MNKFDDMMAYLKKHVHGFNQVIVFVDVDLSIFRRAWCVAELVEARRESMH